ncbi:uncharacterized protein LOC108097319 [Drosophila ficusphila]|uniref:uncharacterized protein LOC108097319 n=1 Tax=Drosophila ficusphila TaxID=30025 RepID=UPI0007E764F7|nr:uncharacterized protein LOC108097319 [Drosophila ficusphila]
MSDYSKFLANLTDQLGLLPPFSPSGLGALGHLGSLGNNLGNLRPAHKALMCVGAATVACVVLGLTVKSLKKGRGRKDDKRSIRNGAPMTGGEQDDGYLVEGN